MMVKDDWVKAAMTDDIMVVELLVRLKQAHALAPIKSAAAASVATVDLPPPRWGLRLPRTRLAIRCDTVSPVKGGDSRRNSPTTPLSWSAGTTSSSGAADGCDDSDLPACGSSRSKGIASNDSANLTTNKSRGKKTFEELKVEESLLLTERLHLKEELATLNATFHDQRARNESLKRIKLDFTGEVEKATSAALQNHTTPSRINPDSSSLPPEYSPAGSCQAPKPNEKQEAAFVLPDLNLMPCEDEPSSEIMYGMS